MKFLYLIALLCLSLSIQTKKTVLNKTSIPDAKLPGIELGLPLTLLQQAKYTVLHLHSHILIL